MYKSTIILIIAIISFNLYAKDNRKIAKLFPDCNIQTKSISSILPNYSLISFGNYKTLTDAIVTKEVLEDVASYETSFRDEVHNNISILESGDIYYVTITCPLILAEATLKSDKISDILTYLKSLDGYEYIKDQEIEITMLNL